MSRLKILILSISMITLLSYTLVHTGGLLARYIHPGQIGYIAAFGIELAIVSLSLRIGELRKSNQDSRFFLFVLISVVVVSAVANISEGFATAHGETLNTDNMFKIDLVQATIGVVATGLISLIVLALSEIIGNDVQTVARLAEKERKAQERELSKSEADNQFPYNIEQARLLATEQAQHTKQEKLDKLLDILRNEQDVKPSKLAGLIQVSRSTVYTYLTELEQAGQIHRNGNGIEIIE